MLSGMQDTDNGSLLKLKIRLISPMLGDVISQGGSHNFSVSKGQSENERWFLPNIDQWRWALGEAFKLTGKHGACTEFLGFPTRIPLPTIRPFYRARSRSSGGGKELYQSFQKDTVITFSVAILSELHGSDKALNAGLIPPTREEVKAAFDKVGEFIGLSPWGSKYGYGRFTVEIC